MGKREPVKLLNVLLTEAVRLGAREIQFEQDRGRLAVRFVVGTETKELPDVPTGIAEDVLERAAELCGPTGSKRFKFGDLSVKLSSVSFRTALGQMMIFRVET